MSIQPLGRTIARRVISEYRGYKQQSSAEQQSPYDRSSVAAPRQPQNIYGSTPPKSLGFFEVITTKYADFEGCADSKEYWTFTLISLAIVIVLGLITLGFGGFIAACIFFMPHLAVGVRRLHDTGRSGWNLLWSLIPFVGPFIVLYLLLQPSISDPQTRMQPQSPDHDPLVNKSVKGQVPSTSQKIQDGLWDISDPNDADLQFRRGISCASSVPPNYKNAAKHFETAAKLGHPTAQFNLGICHEHGHGVLQDSICSHCFYNLAASNGHANAAAARDSIAKAMTPAQVAEAQAMARQWLKDHPAK